MGFAAFGDIPVIGAATQEVVNLITMLNALRARSAGRGVGGRQCRVRRPMS
jgi:hypothetical protein